MTGIVLGVALLAVFIFVLICSASVYVRWWRRKFRQEHSDDGGSVTGHSTHSTASKEMMYFMCWENSSQVAALGLPVSPASTNKDHPPAFVGVDMHPPPPRPPPTFPPPPPSPPVSPMKLPVQERTDLPPKPQAATRDTDRNPAPIPPGYNVVDKVYPIENTALFADEEVLHEGERRRSSAAKIAAGNVFRQPSAELVFTTPAQSPPFYTPVSSPLRTIEGELPHLHNHTSSSLPSSKDVVERLYPKKVMFRDAPHVKIMVG